MTYTVLGYCSDTGRLGVGIATYSLAVGGKCPAIRSNLGAVTSQAFSNPRLAQLTLNLLAAGHTAESALKEALASDAHAAYRQVAVMARDGQACAHSGPNTRPWSGHRVGAGYVALGNVLASAEVVDAVAAAMEQSVGKPLAQRLLSALEAGRDAGGQRGNHGHLPERSASLLVHDRDDHAELDLRVDFHDWAVDELRRAYEEYRLYLPLYQQRAIDPTTAPPQEEWAAQIEANRRP